MAEGVCRLLNTDWGLSTTGVAGPTPQDGSPVGTRGLRPRTEHALPLSFQPAKAGQTYSVSLPQPLAR